MHTVMAVEACIAAFLLHVYSPLIYVEILCLCMADFSSNTCIAMHPGKQHIP